MSDAFKHLDDDNFSTEVAQGVTLVDFYADWCGPCRMMVPVMEQIADELAGKMSVAKLDIDRNQKTTASFQVTSIPTLILFKNGKEAARVVGLKDAATLKKLIQVHL